MSGHDPNYDNEQTQDSQAQPEQAPDETTSGSPAADPQAQERLTAEIPPAYDSTGGWQQGYQQEGYAQEGYPQAGYPQAGYPPPGYAQAGYGYPPAPQRTDDKAIWALVSSIAGFFLCPIVLHAVGWVLANQSLRTIKESRGTLGGDGAARAARVLGIVGVVLYGVLALLGILALLIFVPLGIFAANTAVEQVDVTNETVVPATVSEIDGVSFDHDAGEVTYDLTDIDFGTDDAAMAVDLGAGTLLVEVPEDVTVVVDAQVGAGQLSLFGVRSDGINLNRTESSAGGDDAGTLDLDLNVLVGDLTVSRG